MLRIRSRRRSQGRQKTGSHSEGQPASSRVQAAWVIKGVQSRAHKSLAPSVRCLGEGWEAVQGIFRNTGGSTIDPGKRVSCGHSLIKLCSRVCAYHRCGTKAPLFRPLPCPCWHVATPCSPQSLPPSPPRPASQCPPACPPHRVLPTQTHSQDRALNTSPRQLSHPHFCCSQPPSQSNLPTHTGPCGKVVINPGSRQASRAGTTFQRSGKQANRKRSGAGLGGGAGKKKSVAKDKKEMRWLVSDTLEDKETKDVGSQSSRNREMGWGGCPCCPPHGGPSPGQGTTTALGQREGTQAVPRTGLNLCFAKSLGSEGSGRPGGQTKGQAVTQACCLQRDPWMSVRAAHHPQGPL